MVHRKFSSGVILLFKVWNKLNGQNPALVCVFLTFPVLVLFRIQVVQTMEELRDVYGHFLLHYGRDIPKMQVSQQRACWSILATVIELSSDVLLTENKTVESTLVFRTLCAFNANAKEPKTVLRPLKTPRHKLLTWNKHQEETCTPFVWTQV